MCFLFDKRLASRNTDRFYAYSYDHSHRYDHSHGCIYTRVRVRVRARVCRIHFEADQLLQTEIDVGLAATPF